MGDKQEWTMLVVCFIYLPLSQKSTFMDLHFNWWPEKVSGGWGWLVWPLYVILHIVKVINEISKQAPNKSKSIVGTYLISLFPVEKIPFNKITELFLRKGVLGDKIPKSPDQRRLEVSIDV